MDAHTASFLLCQQQVPLSTYLTVPSGSTYDLTQLQNYLCVVNWTMIAQELSVEFNVTQITDYILGQVHILSTKYFRMKWYLTLHL